MQRLESKPEIVNEWYELSKRHSDLYFKITFALNENHADFDAFIDNLVRLKEIEFQAKSFYINSSYEMATLCNKLKK